MLAAFMSGVTGVITGGVALIIFVQWVWNE
jgi:hypothetical protein